MPYADSIGPDQHAHSRLQNHCILRNTAISMNRKGHDQTAHRRSLIWAFRCSHMTYRSFPCFKRHVDSTAFLFYIIYIYLYTTISKRSQELLAKKDTVNFNDLDTDDSRTMADTNSFLSP